MTRTFLIFSSVLVASALALNCFYGVTQKSGKNLAGTLTSVPCPSSSYCMKITAYGKSYDTFSYGCGDYRCTRTTCSSTKNSVKECCCSKNLCNSGIIASVSVVSILSFVLMKAL